MLTWRLTRGKLDKLNLRKLLRKTGSFGCFDHGWGCIISGEFLEPLCSAAQDGPGSVLFGRKLIDGEIATLFSSPF